MLRTMLKRMEEKAKIPAVPMINDEDDFKEGGAKVGVAKKDGKKSRGTTRSKRKRARVLNDSDSEDDSSASVPAKKSATTPTSPAKKPPTSPAKKPKATPTNLAKKQLTPGRSPGSSKTVQRKLKSSPLSSKVKKVKESVTITDFFGSDPIKRAFRVSNEGTDAGSKPSGKERRSHTPTEVVVIPESPADGNAEFDEVAISLLEDEAMSVEKAKQEEQLVHEDDDFSKTLSTADRDEVCSNTSVSTDSSGRRQVSLHGPVKKLKLMMEKVPVPSKSPFKQQPATPSKATPTKAMPTKATPTAKKTPNKATPTKATPTAKKTPNKATPTKATPTAKKTPNKATPTKATPTKATPTPKKTSKTPNKATPPIGTRSSPRFKGKTIGASPLNPMTSSQSTLNVSRKAKRAISYIDEDGDNGNDGPPKKLSKLEDSSVTRISESPTTSSPVATPPAKPSPSPRPPVKTTPSQDTRRSITPARHTATHKRSVSATSPSPAPAPGQPPKPSKNESYIKYLNRGGPKNPGSKVIPNGAENCLEGLTFVITGVLDSLEREEAAELVKSYGGKVTNSVSGRTSYMVMGEGPGESKLAKASKLEISKIDEDGLLNLIRTRPAHKGKAVRLPPSGKGAKKKSPGAKRRSSSSSPMEGQPAGEMIALGPPTTTKTIGEGSSTTPRVREKGSPECLLWVDKYRPLSTQKVVGQQGQNSNAKKLARWLLSWKENHTHDKAKTPSKAAKDKDGGAFKAALLSGPPGIGKTTTAQLVCKENGYTYIEMNASSCRSKSAIHDKVSSQLSSLSIASFLGGKKEGVSGGKGQVLIMDEVDGMDGNSDRGGISELISLIKTSSVPIICICNDRQKRNMRTLSGHCYDLSFQRPNVKQICAAIKTVCFKEKISIDPQALTEMVVASGQDMRQVLHNLSLWSATDDPDTPLTSDVAMEAARNAKKHMKMNPFNVVRTVFDPREGERELTLMEKSDLFFHDYSMSSLFVQENYLRARPASAKGSLTLQLRCAALAADSLGHGDILERIIRKDSRWELLPLQAFLSSVIPGEHMKGFLGRPMFPQWLGMRSKTSRSDRLLQDLQRHTRLATSCNKSEFGMEYLPFLTTNLTQPLITKGAEGVPDAVALMNHYDLQREDWESLTELAHYSGRPEIASKIPTQVKTAFTKSFNKTGHLCHYATTAPAKKKSYSQDEEEGGEEEREEPADEDGGVSMGKNPMIKVVKDKGKGKRNGKEPSKTSKTLPKTSKGKGQAKKNKFIL